ncbi:G-protein coupled receptor 52 isoform X3 [Neocloeon triangulifer]|uniref:G-protein coupled receptor 52 isoform X3 n=1 Tax=Neocloeon triangulifer TaxID=2078957 RepID=UPI00286F9E95|nr:G-protein coupled receptor 52 isoform X3 [Neocloeon triangulifer]
MFGELCRLCERPAADGGHRAAELDKDKLAEWCLNFLGTTLAGQIDDQDLFCYFCVWDARFYRNNCNNAVNCKNDYDLCWWPEEGSDKDTQDLYKNYTAGKVQQCWVSLEKLPSEEKASANAGMKAASRLDGNCCYCGENALLRGALSQQSAVILICMAIDRYMCMLHPVSYHKHSSKKGCVAIMSLTWVTALTLFAVMVLPRRHGGFYFNGDGLHACEPFFPRPSLRILASCLFYFPTTMVLMYCYGSAFHVNKLRLKRVVCAAIAVPDHLGASTVEKMVAQERRLSTAASRTMAAMSLSFIVMVTPWSIQEVVAACTGSKVPPFMDFLVTWVALSNSFWNPFLYWLLNSNFRRISKELLLTKLLCRRAPATPARRTHCCSSLAQLPAVAGACTLRAGGDSEGISEKYWGEILERTVSSNSLQALQRIYGRSNAHDARLFPSPLCAAQMTEI